MKRGLFAVSGISVVLLTLVLVLAGCATYVPIKSVRGPTINTSGIGRLAIKPFENASGVGGPVGAQLSQYLTNKTTQTITNTRKFRIVAPTDPSAEGVFSGRITSIVLKDMNEPIQRKDRDGNTTTIIRYNREVSLEFQYSVISTRTDMPIGTVSKKGSASSIVDDNSSRLTDTLTLAKQIVDSQMRNFSQDIIPYIVSTNRALMNETSKDKAVKAKMKEAQTLVKHGNYAAAIERYDAIALEDGSIAAQTNAGILREAIASDSAATSELNRLLNERGGLTERAINSAANALNANIPLGENITIIKTQSTERVMLDYVVDQMTKNVVQSGKLRMIDRANQALIDAEQQFQLSGNVSDDSAVSIGKQIGVHYIALCWISGQMSMRRLNIRVLNVETAQIVFQNDFEI